MTYTDIQKLCAGKNITIKSLATQLGFTPFGFRKAIENATLPLRSIRELCELLQITPNELLDFVPGANDMYAALLQQLAVKDEQINSLIAHIN